MICDRIRFKYLRNVIHKDPMRRIKIDAKPTLYMQEFVAAIESALKHESASDKNRAKQLEEIIKHEQVDSQHVQVSSAGTGACTDLASLSACVNSTERQSGRNITFPSYACTN